MIDMAKHLPAVVRCAQRRLAQFRTYPVPVALVLSKNACRVRVATLTLDWLDGRQGEYSVMASGRAPYSPCRPCGRSLRFRGHVATGRV